MILGTINYMSPEQALGKSVDARTDIFSLGIVLYEAATGRLPFRGETVTETITQIVRDEPPDAIRINAGISPGLNSIINKCLRKNRDDRFASASELAIALDQQLGRATTAPMTDAVTAIRPTVVERPPAVKKHTNPWFWAFAVLLLAVIAGAAYMRRQPKPQPPVTQTVPPPTPTTTSEVVVTTSPVAPPPTETTSSLAPPQRGEGGQRPGEGTPTETPATPDPFADFTAGLRSLNRHDLGSARDAFTAALRNPEKLDVHDRAIAELGLAIANENHVEAHRLARIIHNRMPDDPVLHEIADRYPSIAVAISRPREPRPLPRRHLFGGRP